MLSKDDFYDRAKDFALFKDTDGKYFTYDEYKTLIKENQTDKDGQTVYLYANDKEGQYSYIEAAKAKGYSVLLLDGQLDVPMISMLEQKFEKSRFTRVDSDTIDRLIIRMRTRTPTSILTAATICHRCSGRRCLSSTRPSSTSKCRLSATRRCRYSLHRANT